jgi:hypothetical protein
MSDASDRRTHYRATRGRLDKIGATVFLPSGEPVRCEFCDASTRGASVRVLLEHAYMGVGDAVELEVTAPDQHSVRTPARIVSSRQDGDRHIRYGFEFINLGNLYAQLDEFYARWFNRRRDHRGPAELDARTPVRLSWSGHFLQVSINELSRGGLGLALTPEQAVLLERIDEVELAFQLPGCEAMSGTAHVRHRTPLESRVLVGLEFELDSPLGFSRHCAALAEYLEERDRKRATWASSWA